MRKIIATAMMSLDGVIGDPHLWSFDYWSEESEQLNHDQLFGSDALLLGRETYEGFAQAWPTMTDTGDFGERMNSITTYVVSTTLERAEWNNATIIRDNVAEEVAKLKEGPGKDILVYGIGRLAHTLMEHGLLDELRIWVNPVFAGIANEKDLIVRDGATAKMELLEARTLASGIVVLTYRPVKDGEGAA